MHRVQSLLQCAPAPAKPDGGADADAGSAILLDYFDFLGDDRFLAGFFLLAAFFTPVFFTTVFFAPVFLTPVFLTAVFLVAGFLTATGIACFAESARPTFFFGATLS